MKSLLDQQLRRNDCGISAVKTICNVLGVEIAREAIDDRIHLSQEGASLKSMQEFLVEYGFETRYKLLDIHSIREAGDELEDFFPCITPMRTSRGNHFVVMRGVRNNKLIVLDPAETREQLWTIAEFKKKAYFSNSNLQFADLEDILRVKIGEELRAYKIALPGRLTRRELIQAFNKLTYFSYVQENFAFADKEAERGFLKDLILNQELKHLPKHFESLRYNKDKIKLRAPVVLSVKKTEAARAVTTDRGTGYWRLIKSIGKRRELWYIYLATALIASFISYIGVFIDQILIDYVVPAFDLVTLRLFIIGVAVFHLIKTILKIYRRFVSIHFSNSLDRYFLGQFDDKLNTFSIRYLQGFKRGDLTERLSDSMRLKTFFKRYFAGIMVDMIIASVSLVFLFLINWQLSFIVLGVLLFFVGMYYFFTPIIERLERQRYAHKAEFFSKFIEKIDGMQVIRALRLEGYSSATIRAGIDKLIAIGTKSRYVGLVESVLSSIVVSFASLALLYLCTRQMILYQTMSLGQIITFLALSGKIFGAFQGLLDANLSLQEHRVILARFFDFDEHKMPTPEPGSQDDLSVAAEMDRVVPAQHRFTGQTQKIREFEFEKLNVNGVSFAYHDENYIFKNLRLEVKRGEKIWIQGENGSGKSTLCKIMGLLYEPSKGDITLNGLSLDMYDRTRLRKKVVFVSADDLIFNETLLFNIGFGRELDMSRLVEFCKVINFYEFIDKKPDRFNYIIHENARNLSTGQRRKVLLLRALMSGADVIILDEIFNGMDKTSVARAQFLLELLDDTAFVLISHLPVDGMYFHKKFKLDHGLLVRQSS